MTQTTSRQSFSVDYRNLAERAPAILFRYRVLPEPGLEYVNPAVTETLGYTPDDFYADPDLALILLDGHALALSTEPGESGTGPAVVRRWRRRDGTDAEVEVRTVGVRDDAGRLVAIEGIARDVTLELATKRELDDSRARLDAVVSHVPVIVWATDREGRLTFIDGAGLRSIGARPEDLIGKTMGEIHSDAPRYRRHLVMALQGREQAVEVRLGEQAYATRVGPLIDANGIVLGVTGVSTDVTNERRLEAALETEIRERASIATALQRLDPSVGIQALAQEFANEVTTLDGVDDAGIIAFGPGMLAYVRAVAGVGLPLGPDQTLSSVRSLYLRERAEKGPWVERWIARGVEDAFVTALRAAGMQAAAFVPLRSDETLLGILAVGSRHPNGEEILGQRMSALAEFGSLALALMGPELSMDRLADVVRQELLQIIEQGAFGPVYQPIVRLADRSSIAFEALTRFTDGSSPDRRFIQAASVGMGLRLEEATLRRAIQGLPHMPAGTAMALNVSPTLICEGRLLKRLLDPIRQPITLEITEHEQIDDYEAVRRSLRDLPSTVGLAIDDAGAGFASLRHVIELRPDYVKLDRELVSGLDRDQARRAVVAGMVEFARSAGCELIAEGVETETEHETLLGLGVEYGQGYLYSVPKPFSTRPLTAP
jgi:PAS domain S-box-containing protein